MVINKKINFFSKRGFDDEEISKVAKFFGKTFIEQLKKDLSSSPFSLTVGNVTATGKNICGMQVKYLKHYTDEMQVLRTTIENRVIGLKYLECSSSTETIYNAVKEKVFNLSPEIRFSLRGFVHDHTEKLTGLHNGLGVKLKKIYQISLWIWEILVTLLTLP